MNIYKITSYVRMHSHRLPAVERQTHGVASLDELSNRELAEITYDWNIPRWVRESARSIINDRREMKWN